MTSMRAPGRRWVVAVSLAATVVLVACTDTASDAGRVERTSTTPTRPTERLGKPLESTTSTTIFSLQADMELILQQGGRPENCELPSEIPKNARLQVTAADPGRTPGFELDEQNARWLPFWEELEAGRFYLVRYDDVYFDWNLEFREPPLPLDRTYDGQVIVYNSDIFSDGQDRVACFVF